MKTFAIPVNAGTPTDSKHHCFLAGLWRLADPKVSLASISSMFLALCAAAWSGPLHYGWLVVTIAGILAIEIAKNASGEIFDYDSGADLSVAPEDRSPFSGGKRVLVDGILTRKETKLISACAYLVGIASGFSIVFLREPKILWIGIAGVLCAYFYHAPPLKLSYRGLGELAVAACYGPLLWAGTYIVQRGTLDLVPCLTSIPLGLLIANFLWINEFPDATADRLAKKMTLVVRLGKARAARVFSAIFGTAFAGLLILALLDVPLPAMLGLIAVIPASDAVRRLSEANVSRKVIPVQSRTLLTFIVYAAATGIGFLLAR